jgi:hypothetical protein
MLCYRTSNATRLLHIAVAYPALSMCNAAGKNALSEQLTQRINEIDEKFKICSDR